MIGSSDDELRHACGPVAALKRSVYQGSADGLEQGLAIERRHFLWAGGSRPARRGMRAFVDRIAALAAVAATLPIGTIIGLIAVGSANPSAAPAFARSAVLALPVWATFAIATFALTRVVDWRLAVGAGAVLWLAAALVYLHLTSS